MRELGLLGSGKKRWRWPVPAAALGVVLVYASGCALRNQPSTDSPARDNPKIKWTKMTVISDKENTTFQLNIEGENTWTMLGKGKIREVRVPKNHPFTIAAKPEGYREKTIPMMKPLETSPLRFTFEISDREQYAQRPPTPPPTYQPQPARPPQPAPRPAGTSPIGQRWAVVIGVSNYQDHQIPRLRYAARDAAVFHSWLTSADGGGYAPVNTRILLNEDATAQEIRYLLFEWLGQALAEDLVIIYFSGHGTPESPDNPENLYLVPYDADYERIASTGFPMWDIETALKRHIKARKVVVIADACHAGGVGSAFVETRKAIGRVQAGRVTQGLHDLSQAGDGVVVFTSADTDELSQESEKWGGGHGVFTHFILKGLMGEADFTHDSHVTLAELSQYVSEKVRQATRNAQCPRIAGNYDPALILAR